MGLIVETGCGRVEGVEEGGVEVFRGIPYAASAAGAGRWRPPAPREPWSGVRDARRPGPMAPQAPGMISKLLGESGLAMDEDCLSLDVWTPSAAMAGLGAPAATKTRANPRASPRPWPEVAARAIV